MLDSFKLNEIELNKIEAEILDRSFTRNNLNHKK